MQLRAYRQDNLEGALLTAARVLAPGGTFAYSILHPCFPDRGPMRQAVGNRVPDTTLSGGSVLRTPAFAAGWGSNHRMLSTYVNAVANAGFILERVLEPEPGPEWAARQPGADAVPVYFAAQNRKSS